jgi:hypothetical protein
MGMAMKGIRNIELNLVRLQRFSASRLLRHVTEKGAEFALDAIPNIPNFDHMFAVV